MVPIRKGQAIPGEKNLIVSADDGDYADVDLILCAPSDTPLTPTAMLQAQYVKYGPIVYQFNTPEDLGKAVYVIDPDSTLDAVALYKEQMARDAARAAGTLTPSDPVPAPDSPDTAAANAQDADTQFFQEQAAEDTASSTEATSTDTGTDSGGEVLGDATSTPDGTTLPPVVDPGPTSSTTPDIGMPDAPSGPAVDTSTTTP